LRTEQTFRAAARRNNPKPVRGRPNAATIRSLGLLGPRALAAALLVLTLAGCGGNQDVLKPESHAQKSIVDLWWVMLTGSVIGFGSVVFLLYLGWRRRRASQPRQENVRLETTLVVTLGVGVPVIVLLSLFVYADVFVMRSTAAPAPGATRMTIDVIGHQWFWEVRYPGTRVVTANEIHIPVRTPVNVVGTTADVIHSFWVPQLNRKIDLIPGRTNRVLLEADRPGRYRGQCSEFCGLQHAHMAVLVIAEPRAQFRAWLADQSAPARAPSTAEERRGEGLFETQSCAGCHTIRGTTARGTVGPDLTHLASRMTLAALTLPNDPASLRSWIADPQHWKPGAKMPALPLRPAQLQALTAYLGSLR
jgi:cytochrome c oxidase subunit II